MTDKPYTKVEEEILQILDRMESEQPSTTRPRLRVVSSKPKKPRRVWQHGFNVRSRPSWMWLALSFAVAGAAYFSRDFSSTLALLLSVISAALFFGPLFSRSMSTPPSGPGRPSTKTWRGKDITLDPPARDNPADRARRWLDDRRGGSRRF